jgi:hypothetical protein
MPRKEFEAFTRLDASDVNTYLMDQSVMSFGSATARDAAIPSPNEGMTTYLEDINDIRVYDGAKWIGPSGSTLVVNHSFSSSTQVIVSNCFSSLYDVYEIFILPTAGGSAPNLQMRTGAGVTTTTGYGGSLVFWGGGSVTGANRATNAFFTFGNSLLDVAAIKLSFPFNARQTSFLSLGQQIGSLVSMDAGYLDDILSYESLVVNFGNSTSGNIAIYGMRK